ncbi:2-octaprenylphenol hydroxylase [Sulfurivirga caldicuralii]|uniref:2-octaprenylphenol hydroxylase n=1 Tax=Sulfurivirga caldicuralii TaxID=364032 RepID=A0A1N6EPF8_9GAMM|nr:UbiH/UbiF/VisC/COQ6 family ubiquinone biosynthesis hydroxylase [Sulfurivirga caldicuralii]SIN84926.1 2-octaprenylphenol hydroxylase [Sulfurivirga caldicuralii]
MSRIVDTVIVGGGMVGASVALRLAEAGMQVAVVEREPPPAIEDVAPCEVRVSALTHASEQWLEQLGVWKALLAQGAHPFRAMHVWADDVDGEVVFDAASVGEDNLGHVLPNRLIQAALWARMTDHANVTACFDSIEGFETEASGVHVVLEGGDVLHAQLLVGADGAFSRVRQLANIPLDAHEYGEAAIVGCVRTERPHQDACWQRYTAEGPVAFLAMQDNLSSLAWYLPQHKLDWVLSLDDEAFAEALTEASGGRLGRIDWVGERAGFPLVRRHAQRYHAERVVLVGDAAHTIHPQAGQGVNLGFLDAQVLCEEVLTAFEAKAPFWVPAVLSRYQRRRYMDNLAVQRAMDGFEWLFAHDLPWKRPLRQLVMLAGRLRPATQTLTRLALDARPGSY